MGQEPASAFVHEIPVRFGDVDRAGILYYPRFLNYFHVAFEEFIRHALGRPYADVIERDRVGMPMVHLEVDFDAPLAYGDSALVEVRVAKVGRTSVDWRYEVRSRRKGAVTTRARATTVAVDLDTFRPVPVPDALRGPLVARIDGGAPSPRPSPRGGEGGGAL